MKKIFLGIASIITIAISTNAQNNNKDCNIELSINDHYPKADSLNAIMKRYANAGLPGVAIAVYSEKDGWWAGAQGYARIETKTPMQNCNLQYLQSVSKTYMAVTILQLHEQGKMELDAPIIKYLPTKYADYVKHAQTITVRMLLNHSSGIPDYATDPEFVSY